MMIKASRVRRCVGVIAIALTVFVGANAHAAFLMEDLDANRVDLMDYVEPGRWTVVMFWSTDCALCEQQKPGLEAFHRQQYPDTAAIVGVAIDGYEMIDEIEKLNALHDPSYPNLVAFTDVYQRQFQELTGKRFKTTPSFVIFNDKGQLHGAFTGVLPLNEFSAFIAAQN